MTRLSCHRFCSNQVWLALRVLACDLGNLWRLTLPTRIEDGPLTNSEATAGEDRRPTVKHARHHWLLLAEGHLLRWQFRAIPGWITLLPIPT